MDRTLVLVCTYNELSNLPQLVTAIRNICTDDLLVIDDGSPDGTGAWAQEQTAKLPGLTVIQRSGKLGLGSAILHGLRYAIEQKYDWLLNLDADFSHDPADIPKLKKARREDVSLVIGSRYVPGGGLANCSWKRHLVSRCANLYARLLLQWPIADCSSAYRCYAIPSVSKLPLDQIQCQGYGFLEEILWWQLHMGQRVVEVPITYTEREQGESKISIREATGTLHALHRLFMLGWTR